MNLPRTVAQKVLVHRRLSFTTQLIKRFCSDQDEKKAFKADVSSEYFNMYKKAYQHSGLFQNQGNIRAQQLSQEFANIQRGSLPVTQPPESTEATDEIAEANKYFETYQKLFSTGTAGREGPLENESSDYYEEYRKIFQQPHGFETENNKTGRNLTHTDDKGHIKMVDVGSKPDSNRFAKASGTVYLGEKAFHLVKENKLKKGDVMNTAKIAGIMACKNTSQLIPLCHPLALSNANIEMTLVENQHAVNIECLVETTGKTGVEMEALTGVSVAALTVYDMCKAVSHDIEISDIHLLEKFGGMSGDYSKK